MSQEQDIAIRAPKELDIKADLNKILDLFISSQDVRVSSRALYRRTLEIFFNWISVKGYDLSQIARPQILEYKDDLKDQGKTALTIGSYLTSVRKFYEWTEAEKIYPNVARAVKTPKRIKQFKRQPLTPDQAKALIESVTASGSKRDIAMINVLLRTGLRTIEVIRANVGDIVIRGGRRVLLIQGKGRDEKDNFVVLTDKAYIPLSEYIKSRGAVKDTDPLFVSDSNNNRGSRLTTRTISHFAKEALKGIGLDDRAYTAHSMRYTTGVSILRAGGSLRDAQLTLRHSNPATTQIYVSALDEEIRLNNSGEELIDELF